MILLQICKNDIIETMTEAFNTKMGKSKSTSYPYVFRNLTKPSEFTLLHDLTESNALLVQKVDLSQIFDFDVDISMFKTNTGIQDTSYLELLEDFSANGIVFPIDTINHYGSTGNYDEDTAKCFNTFCIIYGIEGLTLFDVTIHRRDNIMTIDVLDYHPFYKGTLEIKTW